MFSIRGSDAAPSRTPRSGASAQNDDTGPLPNPRFRLRMPEIHHYSSPEIGLTKAQDIGLWEDNAQLRKKITELETGLATTQRTLDEMTSNLVDARRDLEYATGSLATKKKEYAMLKQELDSKAKEPQPQTPYPDLREDVTRLESELSHKDAILSQMENDLATNEEKLQQQAENCEEHKRRCEMAESQVRDLEMDVQQQEARFKASLDMKNSEMEAYKRRCEVAELQAREAESQLKALGARYQTQISSLSADLKDQRARRETLETQACTLEARQAALQGENSRLGTELREKTVEAHTRALADAAHAKEVEQLQKRVEFYKERLSRKTKELSEHNVHLADRLRSTQLELRNAESWILALTGASGDDTRRS